MGSEWLGVIIGGLLPAVLFAATVLLARASTGWGTGVGVYMLCVGAAVTLVGLVSLKLLPLREYSAPGLAYAFLSGLCWGLAAALIAYALLGLDAPISKLGALHNTSALLVAAVGLLVFRESGKVNPEQLLLGAVCIVVGGALVIRA